MRICILVRVLWPGGVQRIAFNIAEGLTNLDQDVDLIFIRDTDRVKYTTFVNYKILNRPRAKKGVKNKLLSMITQMFSPERGVDSTIDVDYIWKARKTLRGYDVVLYFDEFSALFSNPLGKSPAQRKYVFIHEVKNSTLWSIFQKFAMISADGVITNSKNNGKLLENMGYNNILAVHPGTHLSLQNAEFSDRKDLIVSVTMWDMGRKPEVFLELASKIVVGRIYLVGNWTDETYKRKIEKIILERNLTKKIAIKGAVSENELVNIYMEAKVFIRFGYDEKGPGMGVLEALGYGLPIIINEGIGATEFIQDGINGFVVDHQKLDIVALRVSQIITDENLWERMRINNKELAKSMSWEEYNKKLLAFLKKPANPE